LFSVTIHNSGSLPATNIEVDIDTFANDEEINEKDSSNRFIQTTKSPITTMLLPNSDYIIKHILNLEEEEDLKKWEAISNGKAKIRFQIYYESMKRKHATIQTEEISKLQWNDTLESVPIPPQNWK